MYSHIKIVCYMLFIGLIIGLPVASAFPFNYSVVSNEEIEFNQFKTVIEMKAVPSVVGVINALNNEKSLNIIISDVVKDGDNYNVYGSLRDYNVSKNKLFNPWWNSSWNYMISNNIDNGSRPYQISLNISNSVGNNNITHVFCNGKCNSTLADVRFLLDNETLLPYWFDPSMFGRLWVNVTGNGTVNMYYGNLGVGSTSNIHTTFLWADDFEDDSITDWTQAAGSVSTVSLTNPKDGIYSMKQDNTGAYAETYLSIPKYDIGNDIIYEVWMWTPGDTKRFCIPEQIAGSYEPAFTSGFESDTGTYDFGYFDGAWNKIGDYVGSTWYLFQFVSHISDPFSTYDLYIYDSNYNIVASNMNTPDRGNLTSISGLSCGDANLDGAGYYDTMRIRRSVSNPPIWTTWSSFSSNIIYHTLSGYINNTFGAPNLYTYITINDNSTFSDVNGYYSITDSIADYSVLYQQIGYDNYTYSIYLDSDTMYNVTLQSTLVNQSTFNVLESTVSDVYPLAIIGLIGFILAIGLTKKKNKT